MIIRNNIIKELVGYFIVWLVVLLCYSFLTSSLLPHIVEGSPLLVSQNWSSFWKSFSNWDGGHYIGIAQNGYVTNYQYAFFPLYPILIKSITLLTQNYLVSAIIVSQGSVLLSLIFFAKLLAIDYRWSVCQRAIIYLLIFPTSIFLVVAYSESLFMLFVILSFYLFRTKKWFLSSIIVSLASATRPIGIVLIFPLIFELLHSHQFKFTRYSSRLWVLLIAPVGLFLYIWFLEKTTGNPFMFISAQAHWQRLPSLPFATLVNIYFEVTSLKNIGSPFFAQQLLNLVMIIFSFGLSIVSFFKLRHSYFIFLSLATILPLTTASTVSFIRLILPVFPIFMILAIWGENRMFNFFWTLMSIMLLSLISSLFINGYWIA